MNTLVCQRRRQINKHFVNTDSFRKNTDSTLPRISRLKFLWWSHTWIVLSHLRIWQKGQMYGHASTKCNYNSLSCSISHKLNIVHLWGKTECYPMWWHSSCIQVASWLRLHKCKEWSEVKLSLGSPLTSFPHYHIPPNCQDRRLY